MPDELFGVFKEEKGLAGGDKYTPPVDVTSRARSASPVKPFIVTNSAVVTGHNKDAWLDKNFNLTTAGDKYQGQAALQKMLGQRLGTPVSTAPFRPTQPPQRSGRASGALYGTFGPHTMLVDTDASLGKNSGRPYTAPADKLRNLYTSTPKQGGPGFPDQSRLLGGAHYVTPPDEYQRARILEKDMKREARAKISRPFTGMSRVNGGCFTPDSQFYSAAPLGGSSRGGRASSPSKSLQGRPSWRPNNPAPRGKLGTVTYLPSGPREAQHKPRDSAKAFVPPGGPHKRLSMWAPNPYAYDPLPSVKHDTTPL